MQWNFATRQNWPVLANEQSAYQDLLNRVRTNPPPPKVTVTGPLVKNGNGLSLEVRHFAV